MTYTTNWSRFVMRYALIMIGIAVVLFAVRKLLDYNLSSSGATMIPIIITTMLEGTEYAKAEKEMPKGRWAWSQSFLFGLFGLGVTMGFSAFFLSAMSKDMSILLTPVGFAVFSGLTVFMAVLFILGSRLFFGMGARNELKAQNRK